MWELFVNGLGMALSVQNLLLMLLGTILGLVFAAIPGLTFSTALVLMIPFTYALDPLPALSVLLGIFCAGMTGGAVSAVLLGIPGTPSAAATVLDGYPMAKQGKAAKALGMAVFASVFGGIFSLLVLVFAAPFIATAALQFGPAEMFALVFFGMATIIGLSEGSLVKGLLSGFAGLFLTTIGMDPVLGLNRFTFGNINLLSGINLMPVMIGMFALPEILDTFYKLKQNACMDGEVEIDPGKLQTAYPNRKELKENMGTLIEGSLIGSLLGAIPGTGGPIASFLSYSRVKKRYPKTAGTGILQGIAGPEAANNAVTGGALIPMLTLGIPGDSATAIMLGAFLVHDLAPGPLLFRNQGDFVYAIFISILIINLLVLLIQGYGIKVFVKVLKIPRVNLMGAILAMAMFGSFAVSKNVIDVVIMFVSGALAYFMKRHGFPVIPLILGLVLGTSLESNFRRALIFSRGSLSIFVTRPVPLIFITLALLMIIMPAVNQKFGWSFSNLIRRKKGDSTDEN